MLGLLVYYMMCTMCVCRGVGGGGHKVCEKAYARGVCIMYGVRVSIV